MGRQTKLSEMVVAMKEKAENAYLNGEIATARHLASVALENWPDGASVKEICWCFAILLHCYKNDTDYYWMSRRFYIDNIDNPFEKKCRFSMDDAVEGELIAFAMEILRPTISADMMARWRENFLKMTEPKLNDDVSTALLLETVIEMSCFWGMDEWETVGMHFATALTIKNGYVSSEVTQCVQRLSLQMRILSGKDIHDEELSFLRPVEALLARAWKAYYCSDFQVLDNLIPKLSNAVACGDEHFLAVQGIATATKFQRSIAQNQASQRNCPAEEQEEIDAVGSTVSPKKVPQSDKKEDHVEPWEYAKYYRYQRFETERPLAAFFALREANAQKIAHQIREKELSENQIAFQCWELFRLLPSLWGSSLKYWDVLSLIKLFELKMEFHWASASYFKNREYSGKANQAVDAIIFGIMSLSSEPYKRKDAKQLIGILEQYGNDKDIQRLYKFIFEEAPPVTWNLCVEWLRLLGDLLPENNLQKCLDWTEKYHEKAGTLLTTFNVEEYYYLHPILQNYALSKAERESLRFHFEKMFQCPPHKANEFKIVLWYLADNDWVMCQEFMEKMISWDNYPRTQAIIINSCADLVRHNQKTLEFCTELLETISSKTNCELYSRFAQVIHNPQIAKVPNLEDVYTALQNAVESSSASGYNSEAFQKVYDHVEGFNWSNVDGKSLQPILEIAVPILSGEKTVHPLYIVNTLSVLCRMFQSAKADAKQLLIDTLLEHTGMFENLLHSKKQDPQAWDSFTFDLYRPELLHNELLLTFCQNYDEMTLEQKRVVLSYAEKKLYYFSKHAYYPTYLFMKASMDDISLYSYTHSGFAELRMAAAGDAQKEGAILSEIFRGVKSVREVSGEIPNVEMAKTFINSVLELGANSLNAANRLEAANLLKNLPQDWLMELQDIKERLAADKRKSVQNAISGGRN